MEEDIWLLQTTAMRVSGSASTDGFWGWFVVSRPVLYEQLKLCAVAVWVEPEHSSHN